MRCRLLLAPSSCWETRGVENEEGPAGEGAGPSLVPWLTLGCGFVDARVGW